jgi:hypothetical protein
MTEWSRLHSFLVCLCTIGLLMPALAVPDWSNVRLGVIPGEGTEDFKLGESLPEEWPETLGEPDLVFWYDGTGEGLRRILWGELVKGQLTQGISLMVSGYDEEVSINDIEIKRIRAGVDDENLFLGLPEDSLSKRSTLVQKDGKKSYLLPGLSIESGDGKLVGMRVHSPQATRWRFRKWRVRPGKAAGPIRIGQPVEEQLLFNSIGDPHEKDREHMLWRADDSNQTLRVTMDPRNGAVTRIHGKGLPWRTPNGATLGDSPEVFSSKHPEARSGFGRGLDESVMKMQGLRATFNRDRLVGFDVYPVPK